MAVSWYLVPLVREPLPSDAPATVRAPVRLAPAHLALDDRIAADGGRSAWSEVLGQHAVVKVRASTSTLAAIAALPGVIRIPASRLNDSLSSLGAGQKNTLRAWVQARGYTMAELQARFPEDIGTYTLRELLIFIARRRHKVRYDAATDTTVDDGPPQPVRHIDDVDRAVADISGSRRV